MIASHYAEPLKRKMKVRSDLRLAPSDESEVVAEVEAGEPFAMLDNSLGWAWGYAGRERRVGYVRASSLTA